MDITFASRKLEKLCNAERELVKTYGDQQARKIMRRLTELRAAKCLGDLWPPNSGPARCHELTGDRKGQLSVDVVRPYRLLFRPMADPLPARPEGGLDWFQVTAIQILGIEDTHD